MFESVNKIAPTLEIRERDFQRKLSLLPKELADKWEEKFEELEVLTEDFFDGFESFMVARGGALADVLEIEPGLNEEIVKEIHDAEKIIRQTYGDPHYFLGNGRVAEVYQLPTAPHLCIKYVKDNSAYSEGNHLRTEFNFIEHLRNHSHEGVRSPEPYFIRIHPSEGHSYGMERINGKSLSQILERPAENVELIKLLKEKNADDVKRRLIAYIKSLHDEFKITHGDLFMRNIMVDEQGNFYIIDFGKSKFEEIGEDHEERRKSDIASITSEVGAFFKAIDNINIY